jgi:hypothetical protein
MDVEYMVFEDEGHGFTKYSNLVKALKRSAEFLVEKYNIILHNGTKQNDKAIPIILLKRKNGHST